MNKTERRHELQQNDLAAYLEQANKRIEPYSKQILVGILLVLAVGVAYSFYNSERDAESSMATLQLIQNTNVPQVDPDVLGEINTEYIETSAGKLAKLYEGMALVSKGNQDIYTEPENAKESLTQGIEVLSAAAANTDDTLIKSRAHLGMALANVTLGDRDAAITAYNEVIDANESEAMVENATSRIAYLESDAGKDFTSWFKDADFKPAQMPNPDPSLPPMSGLEGLPGLNLDLPAIEPTEPSPDTDSETNPLKGDAAPRDLDGGLDLPANDGKPAPTDAEKPATADAEKAAPADAEKAAPAEAEKAAPAEADTTAEESSTDK